MDLHAFRALQTELGAEVLQAAQTLAPTEANYLSHFTMLSRIYPAELCRAALETAILRLEARGKFPEAGKLFFTRTALEQATHWEVSRYRTERYRGAEQIIDLGCSIGSDTAQLAAFAPVIGIDLDPLRLHMAQANLKALEPTHPTRFLLADLQAALPVRLNSRTSLFFDPARRDNQRRAFNVEAYQPALSTIKEWIKLSPNLGVKISPGVQTEELERYQAELEFVSLRGELKEALLWFGGLSSAIRRATILPGPHSYVAPDELVDTIPGLEGKHTPHRQALPVSEPLAYLIEPDAAILRAGLVQPLGIELGASQLDPEIAYLTSAEYIETPFARSWKIETWMPFNLKQLRAALRQRDIGKITVKKRGSPIQPEELIKLLRIGGKQKDSRAERILALTQLRGRPIVVICYPNP
jgi:SAM-dependent methyltransferase